MFAELEKALSEQHCFVNGCWHTKYANIPNLNVLASSTNGTSGIGLYKGQKVYWTGSKQSFKVERA
jgi:hypothetical protein